MGYPTDTEGAPTSTTASALTIPTGAPIAAKVTSTVTAQFNLDARAKIAATAPVTPYSTYGTTMNGYDAQGVTVPIKLYFVKTAVNAWNVFDGDPVGPPVRPPLGAMTFDNAGKILTPVAPLAMTITPTGPNTSVVPIPITVDVSKATQYGTAFAVSDLTQDGYTAGTLTGVNINEQGVITTRYSNGQSQARGQLALADFRNVQGLQPVGQGNWIETTTSGMPIQGNPGVGNFGIISSGSLEASNVDLTEQLVAMMTAQRDYQANAQTIKTQDAALQTLVNLR
jgi:flagellar hook protein FlgE